MTGYVAGNRGCRRFNPGKPAHDNHRRKRRLALCRVVVMLLGTAAMVPARAQTVDYSAFEQMFGEPVTTSATGKPQRASEVPAEMDIITADQIRRSGATNLPDILQFVAGLDVRRYGMEDASVGIRGYNTALNPRVLVLLDGRQVYQDDYGFTIWDLIPVALVEIRQIEIIKGPAAALYGFNAVSGVINILTYDPLRDAQNVISLDGGTQGQAHGEAVATWQIPDRLGVRLSVTGFRSSELKGMQSGNTQEQPHSGTVAADIRTQISPGVQWDLSASIGSLDGDYFVDTGSYSPFGFKANSLRSRLAADSAYGVLQLDVYRNENRTAYSATSSAAAYRQDVTVVQASDLVKIGLDHTVRVGAEYRDNAASSLSAFDGRIGYTIKAASAMWNWQVLPSLAVTNAVRIDSLSLYHQGPQLQIPGLGMLYHSANIVEPSFNSGAVLKISDYDTVRLTAARAIQLPSLVDFGYALDTGPAVLAGNTGLRPSAVTNIELDYDRALPSAGSILRLAAFTQRSDVTIGSPFGSGYSFLPTGQALLEARNFGSSRELGGEVAIHGSSPLGLRWNASYALAAVEDATSRTPMLGSASSVSYQRETPVHSVILGGGYTWDKVELDLQARWQSRYQDYVFNATTFVSQPVTVPNYVTLNGRAGYRLNDHVTLSLVVQQANAHRQVPAAVWNWNGGSSPA